MISGFRRQADNICSLQRYYAEYSGKSLGCFGTTYRSHIQGFRVKKSLENGTDTLFRNVVKKLPLYRLISQKIAYLNSNIL